MAAHIANDEQVFALGEQGYYVADAFLGVGLARAVVLEAAALDYQPAGVGRGGERHVDEAVRGDERCWLERGACTPALAELFARFEALRDSLRLGLDRFDVQLARYRKGARYARHRDALKGPRNRRVTAICYLNDGWTPSDGGELRLHLGERTADIAPQLDRLIVFLSDRLEHEVLPAMAPRLAATAWYYGRDALL